MDKRPLNDIVNRHGDTVKSEHAPKTPDPAARAAAYIDSGLPLQHQQKRSNRYLYVLLALFFVIGISLTAYVLFAQSMKDNSSSQPSPSSLAPIKEKTAAENLIDKVKEALNATPVVAQQTEELNGRAPDGAAIVYSVPSFQLKGYPFSNSPKVGYGTAVTSAASDRSVADGEYDKAVAVLTGNGLKVLTGTEISSASQRSALYANDKIVCATTASYNIRGSDYSGVGCGDIASYEEVAKLIKPLYTAYLAKAAAETKSSLEQNPPMFSALKIEQGADKFSRSTVRLNNTTTELFYRDDNGSWTYFNSVNGAMPCTEFNTPELKKAFDGYPCKDDMGMSTAL